MSPCRLLVILLVSLSICGSLASVRAQSMSATTGPQQMVPYDTPATYPATYPSTADYPATYPFTTTPTIPAATLPPYNSGTSALVASVPSYDDVPDEPLPNDFSLSDAASDGYDTSTVFQPLDSNDYVEHVFTNDECWTWQLLPSGLMYKAYLAGGREIRLASQWVQERSQGWLWDATLGGHVGLIRYGTDNDVWPQGWQLDFEGAAFPRLDLEHDRDLVGSDFRFGIPLTTRQGPLEAKFGYYHLSSHIGDEYLQRHHGFTRINYVRETLLLGVAAYLNPNLRLYSEAGWAFHTDGGAKPWEFQLGADFSPAEPTGLAGAPFFAINAHLREENDFGGNMTVQTGWQWRGRSGHLCRFGMQYFNGMSDQYQFYNRFEEQIGLGLWYDY